LDPTRVFAPPPWVTLRAWSAKWRLWRISSRSDSHSSSPRRACRSVGNPIGAGITSCQRVAGSVASALCAPRNADSSASRISPRLGTRVRTMCVPGPYAISWMRRTRATKPSASSRAEAPQSGSRASKRSTGNVCSMRTVFFSSCASIWVYACLTKNISNTIEPPRRSAPPVMSGWAGLGFRHREHAGGAGTPM
jgi:hypothetical protein